MSVADRRRSGMSIPSLPHLHLHPTPLHRNHQFPYPCNKLTISTDVSATLSNLTISQPTSSKASHKNPSITTTTSSSSSSSSSKPSSSKPSSKSAPTKPLAENWDDESLSSSSSGTDTETEAALPTEISTGSSAPPPTPLSPTGGYGAGALSSPFDSPYAISSRHGGGNGDGKGGAPLTPLRGQFRPDSSSSGAGRSEGSGGVGEEKRPEKSTAVAARMIAAGLGVRAPKKTEEMLRYEKAAREKEERRLKEERDERARNEDSKRAIWED